MTDELLTTDELDLINRLGQCASRFALVIGDTQPNGVGDTREVNAYIHALQALVMSNAAAHAYPDRFRLLGASMVETDVVVNITCSGSLDPFPGVAIECGNVLHTKDGHCCVPQVPGL